MPNEKLLAVTPEDLETLRRAVEVMRRYENTSDIKLRAAFHDDPWPAAAGVHIVKTPGVGADAITAGDPPVVDSAPCESYQVVNGELLQSDCSPIDVYNLNDSAMPANTFGRAVLDRSGVWTWLKESASTAPEVCGILGSLSAPIVGLGTTTTVGNSDPGDLMIVSFRFSGTTPATPPGYTLMHTGTLSGGLKYWIGYKYAVSGVSDVFTFDATPSGYSYQRHRGAAFETSAATISSGSAFTAPSVTSAGTGRLLFVLNFRVNSEAHPSAPAGMTHDGAAGPDTVTAWFQEVGSGSTGTRATTLVSSQAWAGVSYLLKPGSVVTGGTAAGDALACGKVIRPATASEARINIGVNSTPPSSASAFGEKGQIAIASGWLYVCVAANTWQRVAIATW